MSRHAFSTCLTVLFTIAISLLLGACGSGSDYLFEQQVREAGPIVQELLGIMDQVAFDSKKSDQAFDPKIMFSALLRSKLRDCVERTDLYYINTNQTYWMYNELTTNIAIAKRVMSKKGPSRVLYVCATFGCQTICSSNLCQQGLVPVMVQQ